MKTSVFFAILLCCQVQVCSASTCQKTGETCVDTTASKVFNGVTVTLAQAGGCWQYQDTYSCIKPAAVNYCQPFINAAPGCWQTSSVCAQMDTTYGTGCMQYTQTYQCGNSAMPTAPTNTVQLADTYTLVSTGYNTSTCPAATTASCSIASTTCTSTIPSPPLPPGISPAAAAPDGCYQQTNNYACTDGVTSSDCGQFSTNPNCSAQSSNCVNTLPDGTCGVNQQTYSCMTTPASTTTTQDCSGTTFCQGGNCFNNGAPPDNAFATATALMEAGRQGGVYNQNGVIFSGVGDSCRIRLFGLGNCCKTKPAAGYSNNATMGAVFQVGGQALATGTKYAYDALYPSNPGWLKDGFNSLTGAPTLSTFSPSLSLYGFSMTYTGFTTSVAGTSVNATTAIAASNTAMATSTTLQGAATVAQQAADAAAATFLANPTTVNGLAASTAQQTANLYASSSNVATSAANIAVVQANAAQAAANAAASAASAAAAQAAADSAAATAAASGSAADIAAASGAQATAGTAAGVAASDAQILQSANAAVTTFSPAATGMLADLSSTYHAADMTIGAAGGFQFTFNYYALALQVAIMVYEDLTSCNQDEQMLGMKRGQNLCTYTGTYCSTSINLLVGSICVENTQAYCCYNSLLAKIINEQGRVQIGKGYGNPQSPDCSGFSTADFAKIDFSKIDLSAFTASIMASYVAPNTPGINQNATGVVQQKIQNYYSSGHQ